ncbi:MAG: hypothetical protein E7376_05185 [Clostridiales bacterium]|nr:hypothetical protein [Clostridiales bacterium]
MKYYKIHKTNYDFKTLYSKAQDCDCNNNWNENNCWWKDENECNFCKPEKPTCDLCPGIKPSKPKCRHNIPNCNFCPPQMPPCPPNFIPQNCSRQNLRYFLIGYLFGSWED